MGGLIINPGTGPVVGATEEQAATNLVEFVADLGLEPVAVERAVRLDYGEGRFAFILRYEGRSCEVQMPGRALSGVRYTGEGDQNIWHFPRLYVDGSSWVWGFAVGIAHDLLTGSEEDDAS